MSLTGFEETNFQNEMAPDWNRVEATRLESEPALQSDSMVVLPTNNGDLCLKMYHFGIRLYSDNQRLLNYGLITTEPEAEELELENEDGLTVIVSPSYSLRVWHKPFSIELVNHHQRTVLESPNDGHFVRKHRVPPLAKTKQGWFFSLALKSGDAVYGLGEKWGALNKRGQLIRSYNHDALGVNAEISYKNVPFCWSPEGWGLFVNTPSPVTHAVGFPEWSQRSYCVLVEDQALDVFLFSAKRSGQQANAGKQIIGHYCDLTGYAPTPPKWSAGVILSKAFYKDSEEVISTARQVREKKMPCDVITLDGRAWQDTATRFSFEWCRQRYPEPSKIMGELKRLNFKVCLWEYPLISINNASFKEFSDKGWLLKDKRTGETYRYRWDQQAFNDVLTPLSTSGILDFTHPDAYEFWRDAHKPLFELGVDMIKADFGEQVDDDNMLAFNGEFGSALHNVYSHLYNRCVYEAAERYSKSGSFIFSRSSWTGCQRFNSQWGGDPQADWEGMMGNIRGGLSWGMSGGPFYATDVGGFYKDTRDDALYVRWAQAAVFSAHYRLHGIGAREPWSYSKQAEKIVTAALKLRYQLLAYLWLTIKESSTTGMPVQRPMVLAFPEEKQSWAFENQFMFGDDLLVVPCFDPSGDVEFYLPEGKWHKFDLENKGQQEVLTGQKVIRKRLKLDEIAVYARSDSTIPISKAVEYTDQYGDQIEVVDTWKATNHNLSNR